MNNQTHNTARDLKRSVSNAQDVLVTATTVFPFTLFPDTIRVDREKLTITHRSFFKVSEVMSIHIEDVLNVTVHTGPFFGSLEISTRFFSEDKPYKVTYFWRKDALKIKAVVQGYIIARQKNIPTDNVDADELSKILRKLGAETPAKQ